MSAQNPIPPASLETIALNFIEGIISGVEFDSTDELFSTWSYLKEYIGLKLRVTTSACQVTQGKSWYSSETLQKLCRVHLESVEIID